ncbi:DUF2252 domain-containing protein [Mycolicibacterium palauense]|uniref:DUF2252 domain-containing protein n=1 Tax=Mycolicibacterium palauense TaxID=2034511 RepID=UPI001FE9B109|nr:DUF2252 domain-containing protein [Mycolicibacterium palauense]
MHEWDRVVRHQALAGSTQRKAEGRALRAEVPLTALAEVPAQSGRADPMSILIGQDQDRVPELVPIRHGRMSASPFAFYRGSAAIMAADLASTPRTTGLDVQLCGDAHLSNFGLFKGPDRRLVFDVNDFDETLPGPFDWDLKRLATSVTIAARSLGVSRSKAVAATRAAVAQYRKTMATAIPVSPLHRQYYRLDYASLIPKLGTGTQSRRNAQRAADKAAVKNSLRAFDRLTEAVDGQPRIKADWPLITRFGEDYIDRELGRLKDFLLGYLDSLPLEHQLLLRRYRLVDVAHKVVGVGSVGTRCLILLLVTGDGAPLFLQFKEAVTSVLEAHLGPSAFRQAGERVVRGQRLMQSTGDIFLGWSRYERPTGHRDYYFRQLWDGKGSLVVEDMGAKMLQRYAALCGGALAVAHARTGDPAMIAGYLGDDEIFDDVITTFAEAYADIAERDYATHGAAIDRGRIAATCDLG